MLARSTQAQPATWTPAWGQAPQSGTAPGPEAAASLLPALDQPMPEPPGRLIKVDGHRMHLHASGQGHPTVLLEAGLLGWSLQLRALHQALAPTTRVCTYDRAGYGWSERGPAPRTLIQIVTELETLLQAAEEDGPYLLAGHSLGGLAMLMFAQAHPDDVAGVVLIDSAHPGQQRAFRQVAAMVAQQASDLDEVEALAARVEAGRIPAHELLALAPDFLPPRHQQEWATLVAATPSLRTSLSEFVAWTHGTADVGGAGSLGDIPLVVLARGRGFAAEAAILAQHPEDAKRVDAIWRSCQEDHLTRSSNSRLVIAENSGHYIYASEPELVIDAIHALMPGR